MAAFRNIKRFFLGRKLDPGDKSVFHQVSLIAFFAWVGLGADGLSSSCYGPSEAFNALGEHKFLAIFVGLATAVTIFVISSAYSQIIELFPTGGGGYVVASKLLSPSLGMISGCALMIDYVLTIALSIASGADALFSFLPPSWHAWRLAMAVFGVLLLTYLNLRGVRESINILVPIFMIFVLTHAFAIFYGLSVHLADFPALAARTAVDAERAHSQLGFVGMVLLVLHSYSLGAGTYTGIEAVSNGIPILREPKAHTARKTMVYMSVSLATTVLGLILGYILYDVRFVPGKTLNAVLFESITADWGGSGYPFVLVTLISEAAILFVAAQAGFLDGPRVLANMAQDRWFPTRFATLSDRLVTQNGILLMGASSLLVMIFSHGSVDILIVLYSINVFVTFVMSQLGMVRHWWSVRGTQTERWIKGLAVNGLGLFLTGFILITISVVKFEEGGWVTILITGLLVSLAMVIQRHYRTVGLMLKELDSLAETIHEGFPASSGRDPVHNKEAKTAVLLVNGFNGLGLHTLLNIRRLFGNDYESFVFVQVGMVDAGVFKGADAIDELRRHVDEGLDRYIRFVRGQGYYAEGIAAMGIDVVGEITRLAPKIVERFPNAVFFGGQIVFPQDSIWVRMLHNYAVFAVQRQLFQIGIPFIVMPIRI